MHRSGLSAGAALAFEDSRNGLVSAQSAGLRVVVTPSIFTAGEDFSGAARVLHGMADFDMQGISAGWPG